jgi:hypothetical protein
MTIEELKAKLSEHSIDPDSEVVIEVVDRGATCLTYPVLDTCLTYPVLDAFVEYVGDGCHAFVISIDAVE